MMIAETKLVIGALYTHRTMTVRRNEASDGEEVIVVVVVMIITTTKHDG